ncbi:MAG: type II toxin-antitoxin system HicA family toxin [Oscillospiraceae bacterium]|nr:type II toxin-antitoxin system HicA family toxin [Oscillospiraceae bacterium]
MTALQVEKIIVADGWYYVSTKGSHKHFKHPTKPGKVTIPQHKGDLDIKTVNSILRQAGLK